MKDDDKEDEIKKNYWNIRFVHLVEHKHYCHHQRFPGPKNLQQRTENKPVKRIYDREKKTPPTTTKQIRKKKRKGKIEKKKKSEGRFLDVEDDLPNRTSNWIDNKKKFFVMQKHAERARGEWEPNNNNNNQKNLFCWIHFLF